MEPAKPGTFIGKKVPTADGKVQLWPEKLVLDLPRLQQLSEDFLVETDKLRLIGQRERRTHNSWIHTNSQAQPSEGNRVLINPDDAGKRGISETDEVEISSYQGSIRLKAKVTAQVSTGVIAIPHGRGHHNIAPGLGMDSQPAAVNDIIPGGSENMEPVSGQAIMLAHLVDVKKVEGV